MTRFFLAAALFLLLAPLARADEFEDYRQCLLKVSDQDLAAKIAFQTDLAALITGQSAKLGALANLNRDFQIARAKARKLKLDYVIREDLPRLVSASGLTRFMNFDWSNGDEARLQAANDDYAALIDQIEVLGEDTNNNPDWPGLRALFIKLQEGKDFQKILNEFNKEEEKAGKRLEGC